MPNRWTSEPGQPRTVVTKRKTMHQPLFMPETGRRLRLVCPVDANEDVSLTSQGTADTDDVLLGRTSFICSKGHEFEQIWKQVGGSMVVEEEYVLLAGTCLNDGEINRERDGE